MDHLNEKSTPSLLCSKRFRSEQRKTRGTGFSALAMREMNKSQKMETGEGGGEGRKCLQTNPSILKTCIHQRTQCLIGLASWTILTCVDQRFVSYWEVMDGTWSARFALQCKSIFIDLFWNVKLFLRLNKGFRSFFFILLSASSIWITKSDFLLSANVMVSCKVLSCWVQLVSVFFFRMLNSLG